jgi:hypothetical protein
MTVGLGLARLWASSRSTGRRSWRNLAERSASREGVGSSPTGWGLTVGEASSAVRTAGAVLVLDTGGIQDWIIGHATELRHIRGGSNLVAQAFADLERDLDTALGTNGEPEGEGAPREGWWRVIRSSGRLVAVLPDLAAAQRARAIAAARLADAVPGLEVTAGIAALDGAADAFTRALATARRDATALVPVVLAAHDLGAETCEVSGVATALAGRSGPDAVARRATATRRRADADEADLSTPGVVLERRIDHIGKATPNGRFRGYVGVVCADGDGVGARFASMRSARELRGESDLVHDAVEAAERAAYEAAVAAHGSHGTLPVNPVIRAGDDLRFVVPAHVALEFALGLATGSQQVPISVGVLICHSGLPFATAHDAASALLDVAKADARHAAAGGGDGPRIAFAVESGAGVRGQLLDHRVSASPYRPDQLRALLDVRLEVSTGQLRDAMVALRRGGRVAHREWALHRLEAIRGEGAGERYRAQLAQLWTALGCTDPDEAFPAQRHRGGAGSAPDACSPVGDLLLIAALRGSGSEVEA